MDSEFAGPTDRRSVGNLLKATETGRGPGVVQSRRAIEQMAEQVRRNPAPGRRQAIGEMGVGMVSLFAGPWIWRTATAAKIDFATDFHESDPLQFWRFFENSSLRIEKVANRVAARPEGALLLEPSARMHDGEVLFRLALGPTAARFILRGADDKNGYVLLLSRVAGSKLRLEFRRLRRGRLVDGSTPVVKIVEDLRITRLDAPWLRIQMDGKYFTAWLEWDEPHPLGRPFQPLRQTTVVHTWTDKNYSQGAVGLLGPQLGLAEKQAFHVYSVAVSSRPFRRKERVA